MDILRTPAEARVSEDLVDRILAHLDLEIAAQAETLDLLARKEGLIIRHDVAGLRGLLEGSAELLERLEDLGRHRSALAGAVAAGLGRDAGEIRISTIIAAAPGHRREALRDRQARLRAVLEDVGRQNRRNNVLVRHSLEVGHAIVAALFDAGTAPRSYSREGRLERALDTAGTLDRRA